MPHKTRRPKDTRPKYLVRLDAELAKREAEVFSKSFRAFVEGAWEIIEPGAPFLPGMHIEAICEHLEACARRDIRKLLITIPPRHSKSSLVSVLYPAWLWTHTPTERSLFASYSLTLATRDSVRTRRIIESEWFQRRWPVLIFDDQNTKTNFENDRTGGRQVTSVTGPTTGLGGSHLILDDPHNVLQADSATVREQAVQWFREAWSTRANTPDAVRIVIQQRVHQQDVAGYCMEEGGWEHLNLPMEYEGDSGKITSLGWRDTRTEFNQILWPERYSRSEINTMKKGLGTAGVAGQFQQRPVPRGGGTFKKEWIRYWYDEELGYPPPVMVQKADGTYFEAEQRALPRIDDASKLASWDLAFKGGVKNDFVVGQVWASGTKDTAGNRYLLDQDRGQYDFVATQLAVERLSAKHPTFAVLVEDKANGAAIISSLKGKIPGLIPVNPLGGKESRANAIAPIFEAGNVWFPHPKQFPWVDALVDELLLFPRGAYDDQVDAMSQALSRMRSQQVENVTMSSSIKGFLQRVNPWAGA